MFCKLDGKYSNYSCWSDGALKLNLLPSAWSARASVVNPSRADVSGASQNIIGFLSRQNYEFDHTISSLTEVKAMLASAR